MDWMELIAQLVAWLVSSGLLVVGARWIAKRVGWNMGREATLMAIDAMGSRAASKYKAEYELELDSARAADSDGGATITAAEKQKARSLARDKAYSALLKSLPEVGLDVLKSLGGEEAVKGMIDDKIDAKEAKA